jgi:threonine/homoserine/homoserine lactone efflux protein
MIDAAQIRIFLPAAVLLAALPGPGMLYVLARSLQGGRPEGLASSFGTATGGMVHVVAGAFGLSAILARSASAFLVIKYLGAAYLIYLGIRSLRSAQTALPTTDVGKGAGSPFLQGVVTEVLNPKTALFFLAFIPQFIHHSAPLLTQFLTLGSISVALNTLADIVVVLAAVPLARRLISSPLWLRRQRQASGAVMIGLGGFVALSSES